MCSAGRQTLPDPLTVSALEKKVEGQIKTIEKTHIQDVQDIYNDTNRC